jgi:sugar-specific transcriptional regulator TrmB
LGQQLAPFFLFFNLFGCDRLSLERIFKALTSLGLSEPDARVYIFLALKGPKKPDKIVDKLKISNKQIIQSLKNLENRGILTDIDSQKGYSALPFEKALKLLIKAEKEKIISSEENLISNWKSAIKK